MFRSCLPLCLPAPPPRRRSPPPRSRSTRRSIMPAIARLDRGGPALSRGPADRLGPFLAAAGEPDVLILDARSGRQFAAGHIAGAVNVPLPEFSEERLAEVIGRRGPPDPDLLQQQFPQRPPAGHPEDRAGSRSTSRPSPPLGYGYRNMRELNDVMDIDDPRVPWVTGASAAAGNASRPRGGRSGTDPGAISAPCGPRSGRRGRSCALLRWRGGPPLPARRRRPARPRPRSLAASAAARFSACAAARAWAASRRAASAASSGTGRAFSASSAFCLASAARPTRSWKEGF